MDTYEAQKVLEGNTSDLTISEVPDFLSALNIALIILIAFNNALKEVKLEEVRA